MRLAAFALLAFACDEPSGSYECPAVPEAPAPCHDFQADTAFFGGACPHPEHRVRLQLINDDTYAICECIREERP